MGEPTRHREVRRHIASGIVGLASRQRGERADVARGADDGDQRGPCGDRDEQADEDRARSSGCRGHRSAAAQDRRRPMTMLVAGIALWTLAVVLLTWLAARRKPPEPQAVINAEAQAVQQNIESQKQALQEIADDVERFDLADYLNDRPDHKPDSTGASDLPDR